MVDPRAPEAVAHDEMKYTSVATKLFGGDPVHKVSIIARGIGSLRHRIQQLAKDRYLTKSRTSWRIKKPYRRKDDGMNVNQP